MPGYRKSRSVIYALALAFGLAACGGGGGSSGPMTDPAVEQRLAIGAAIREARTAVAALDEEPTEAALAAAEAAVDAAKTAVMDANALTMDETDGYGVTISLLEDRLAPAMMRIETALAEEAARVLAAFDGPGIGEVGATVVYGAAPAMAGTVLATPPVTVRGLATVPVAGSRVTAGAWTGGAYTASDRTAGVRDRVVLYTDIAEPGARPFSGEGGKYDDTNGLDGEGNLPISKDTDATLIASSAFPTAAGIREHAAGPDGEVVLAGRFDGAEGAYACTPAAGSPCTSSVRHGGGIVLAGGGAGGWKFLPAAGAVVPEPDAEYRYFGWWQRAAGGARFFAAFDAGAGTADDEFASLVELQGEARWRGPAAGTVVIGGADGPARAEEFTAMAALTAAFGDGVDPGTVEGVVDGFQVDGESMSWSVALGAAAIRTDGSIGADTAHAARTVWTVEGMEGPASAHAHVWRGQFHEAGADHVPSAATGTFEAAFGDTHRMIGAFGTTRLP